MTRWLWADLHLSHEKIILYSNRPFSNVEEMSKSLLKTWREMVKKRDMIFVLGDFSFYRNKEGLQKIVKNLPGFKILILGNHDQRKNVNFWQEVGFNEVYKYPIIYKEKYVLSHEPILYGVGKDGYINIHGHIHNQTMENPYYVNVSVEAIDYKPISFEEIEKRFKGE